MKPRRQKRQLNKEQRSKSPGIAAPPGRAELQVGGKMVKALLKQRPTGNGFSGRRSPRRRRRAEIMKVLALPAPKNQSRLAVLGATVRAELVAIGRPTAEILAHAITLGAALHEAKRLIRYGKWQQWLQEECGLSLRTALIYLQLFEHRDQVEALVQRAAQVQELSIRGALRFIRTGSPTRKRKTTSPLKVASWKAATPAQRTSFVAGIPLTDWLASIPAGWRTEIIDRIDGLRAAQAKPVMQMAA
jgi:hypothetical protein